jgi:hypothetical protein
MYICRCIFDTNVDRLLVVKNNSRLSLKSICTPASIISLALSTLPGAFICINIHI